MRLKHLRSLNVKINIQTLALAGVILILPATPPLQADQFCSAGIKSLQADNDVLQSRGGLWGLFEKAGPLKDKSMIGLQVDGKLSRLATLFRTTCEEGKTPDMGQVKQYAQNLEQALVVSHLSPDRTSPDKILAKVTQIGKNLDGLLAKMEK